MATIYFGGSGRLQVVCKGSCWSESLDASMSPLGIISFQVFVQTRLEFLQTGIEPYERRSSAPSGAACATLQGHREEFPADGLEKAFSS